VEVWFNLLKHGRVKAMNENRRNKNRGYQQLYVWSDSIQLYRLTCDAVRGWPFEFKKVASQAIASADSVHRNIAEGYCRRSIKEYIAFLYISLGSLGESVSGYSAFRTAGQITPEVFEGLDALAYKIENGMLRLVESLERKRDDGDWTDSLIVRESNSLYDTPQY
jgi:four helix bundle protein